MKYDEKSWMISLERLNQDLGYIKTNIAFCCAELNHRNNWTHTKIDELLNILDHPIQDNILNFDLEKKIPQQPIPIIKTIINNIEYYNCNHCLEIKVITEFTKHISQGCKLCKHNKQIEDNTNPRRCLQVLLNTAKLSTERRKKTKTY